MGHPLARAVRWARDAGESGRADGARAMTVGEIAALVRRHWVAAAVVLVLAGAALHSIKSSPPGYQESSTIIFIAPRSNNFPNPYDSDIDASLITTAEVVVRDMMSPQSQSLIQAAGGSADYSVELVNLYNQEYPDYGVPDATITTTATSWEAAHSTYVIVARQLTNRLAGVQAKVKQRNRITAVIVGDSGPIIQTGSPKRVYAGLVLLTVVAFFMLAIFLDRHPGLAWRRARSRGAIPLARRRQASEPS